MTKTDHKTIEEYLMNQSKEAVRVTSYRNMSLSGKFDMGWSSLGIIHNPSKNHTTDETVVTR